MKVQSPYCYCQGEIIPYYKVPTNLFFFFFLTSDYDTSVTIMHNTTMYDLPLYMLYIFYRNINLYIKLFIKKSITMKLQQVESVNVSSNLLNFALHC